MPDPAPLLSRLSAETHVVLVVPTLDVNEVALRLADPRVNHLLRQPNVYEQLRHIGEKLATGGIFGMERILPAESNIVYSSRGIWSVLFVWILGHLFLNTELSLRQPGSLLARLIGACLICAAIALVTF